MSVGKDSILRAANADAKKTEVKVLNAVQASMAIIPGP